MWSIRYTIIFHTFIDFDYDTLNVKACGDGNILTLKGWNVEADLIYTLHFMLLLAHFKVFHLEKFA